MNPNSQTSIAACLLFLLELATPQLANAVALPSCLTLSTNAAELELSPLPVYTLASG